MSGSGESASENDQPPKGLIDSVPRLDPARVVLALSAVLAAQDLEADERRRNGQEAGGTSQAR